MNYEERNKFLTEAMGECWHEAVTYDNRPEPYPPIYCCKCNQALETVYYTKVDKPESHNETFSTRDGFFKLWRFAQGQEWFSKFLYSTNAEKIPALSLDLIDPDRFANAVCRYLKEGI